MHVDFPSITVEHDDAALILRSEMPLHIVSSAVVGGGFMLARTIINRHVAKNYDCSDPAADLRAFAHERGVKGAFVGLLTAIWMRKARSLTLVNGDLRVTAVIPAVVRNATAAGISSPYSFEAGTINLVLLIDGNLVPGAEVNAVKTVTEAETAVLYERGVYTPEGIAATGTSTDAVVIACTRRGAPLAYAGPATPVGYLLARAVRECLPVALDAE